MANQRLESVPALRRYGEVGLGTELTGPGGDGFVRFALIENEQRIAQAMRNLKKALPKLG